MFSWISSGSSVVPVGLARALHFTRINLGGLNAEEVQAFIAAAGPAVPATFAKTLHEQSEGNPLFLREIVRFLEQRGALAAGPEAERAMAAALCSSVSHDP